MTTPDRSDHRARAVFWILSALGAASLVWRGRPQWFTFDDWTLLVTRRRVWETEGLLDFLFLPHNEHMLPGLTLWDIGLASAFGIDSYLPWTLTIVGVLVFTSLVLRQAMHALGVPALLAATTAPVVMIWPTFDGALTWAPETVFILYLALGLTHLLLVIGDEVDDRQAALGAFLSTLAILFHSGAALTTGVIVLVLGATRQWRAAAWSSLPLLGYGLWLVTWGNEPKVFATPLYRFGDPTSLPGTTNPVEFVGVVAGQGFRFLIPSVAWVAWLVVVGTGGIISVRSRGKVVGRTAFALVGLSLVSLAAITVSRAEIGAFVDANPQSRYSVLIVMPLLPLIALELHLAWQWFRVRLTRTRLGEARTTQVMAIAGAACIAVFSMAVITSTERESDSVRTSRLIRRTMSAIVSTPSTRETRSDIALMPFFFDLDVGGVWSLVDWGWFEPEEVTDPKNLLAIQARFLVYSGLHEPSDDPVTLHLGADVESDRGEGSCVSLSPLSDSNRVALIRGTGPSFMVITDGAENVELRALRDGVRSNWHRLLDDPTTSDVRILSDPEVDLVMRLLGPATFCETSVIDTAG